LVLFQFDENGKAHKAGALRHYITNNTRDVIPSSNRHFALKVIAMAKATIVKNPPLLANAFIGKPKPTDKELTAALGPAKSLWDQLLAELADELKLPAREWNSYSKKAGWSLHVKRGDRIVLYLAPLQRAFRASFALGDKAVQAAKASGLPKPVLKIIESAKKYAEGTAVRIDVNSVEDIHVVKKLAKAKMENGSFDGVGGVMGCYQQLEHF
jgi:hypothetical protein